MISTHFIGGEVGVQRVKCNAGCHQEFALIGIGTVQIQEDIEAVGFTCPNCGRFYGHYQNDKIKSLQREQRKLLRSGKSAQGSALRRILQRIESMKSEIKEEMDRLRVIMEGGAANGESAVP